ncbi:MAG: tRNA pseudouridine(55) synthase TruB [Planctomycetota bacterium]
MREHAFANSAKLRRPMDAALQGILVVDKPHGMTSMRAVERVRRLLGGAKAGHAGTLDPLATGVLVVAIGRATKEIPRLMGMEKRYETEIDLSATTETLDTEAERVPVDPSITPPTRAQVEAALLKFKGTIRQAPPAFSAVKIAGRRAYDLARKGEAVEPAERDVTVHAIELLDYTWPVARLSIRCAKGFYVRSLARDLAKSLGLLGHCLSIRRTAVGPYEVSAAMQLTDSPQPLAQSILPISPPADSP